MKKLKKVLMFLGIFIPCAVVFSLVLSVVFEWIFNIFNILEQRFPTRKWPGIQHMLGMGFSVVWIVVLVELVSKGRDNCKKIWRNKNYVNKKHKMNGWLSGGLMLLLVSYVVISPVFAYMSSRETGIVHGCIMGAGAAFYMATNM